PALPLPVAVAVSGPVGPQAPRPALPLWMPLERLGRRVEFGRPPPSGASAATAATGDAGDGGGVQTLTPPALR
ncbi:hypothetical protein MHW47_27690, partial [Streptomyces sp. OfavH-34-F]|nr:hypothetical protein [Streptomyces sp. OfavH-34-F]